MILDLFKLDGKVALVTGAGQGLAPTLYRDIWRPITPAALRADPTRSTSILGHA
jgi:hypothetical protein